VSPNSFFSSPPRLGEKEGVEKSACERFAHAIISANFAHQWLDRPSTSKDRDQPMGSAEGQCPFARGIGGVPQISKVPQDWGI
jgi:hypothetical protein